MKSFVAATLAAVVLGGGASDLNAMTHEAIDTARAQARAQAREEEFRGEAKTKAAIQGGLRELQCWWAGLEPVDEDQLCSQSGMDLFRQEERDACLAGRGNIFDEELIMCFYAGTVEQSQYKCSVQQGGIGRDGKPCDGLYMANALKKRMFNMRKGIHQKATHKTFTEYQASLNLPTLEAIGAPIQKLDEEAQRLGDKTVEALAPIRDSLGAEWAEYFERREAAGVAANDQLLEYLGQALTVDGTPVSELLQDRQILLRKTGKSMMKPVQQQDMPTDIKVTYNGPSNQQVEQFINENIRPSAEIAQAKLEYIQAVDEKLSREYSEALRAATDPVIQEIGEQVSKIIDASASAIKSQRDSVEYEATMLAEKAAAQNSASSSVMTGIGAGLVGALTGAAVFGFLNRSKRVASQEQPLL